VKKSTILFPIFLLLLSSFLFTKCELESEAIVSFNKDDHISLIGNNLCSRMMNFGYFETEIQAKFIVYQKYV